jgi:hypothetical protein
MSRMTIDSQSYSLAYHFIGDKATNPQIIELAQRIQRCVEDWMEDADNDAEAKRQDASDRAWGI